MTKRENIIATKKDNVVAWVQLKVGESHKQTRHPTTLKLHQIAKMA